MTDVTPPFEHPHRRYDPLADEWLLVSTGRSQRPWQGGVEPAPAQAVPAYDPACYLCPGNDRAGGARNPAYDSTFVFTNDFAALRPDVPDEQFESGLLRAESEAGTCRVICFSPRHDLHLGRMAASDVRAVVDLWAAQTTELGATWRWVQVFENRGAAMGASNPHPHGQVWAGASLPTRAARELEAQRRHHDTHGSPLLLDYAAAEARHAPRLVGLDADWLVVVPFWAAWPYETLLVPRAPAARLDDLAAAARDALAETLVRLIGRYDGLFGRPFPYSMGWHQAPFDGEDHPEWQLHAHVYPPLLRGDVRKFMVGYELLAEPQRDISPEAAAAHLRAVPAGDGG